MTFLFVQMTLLFDLPLKNKKTVQKHFKGDDYENPFNCPLQTSMDSREVILHVICAVTTHPIPEVGGMVFHEESFKIFQKFI